MKYSFKNKILYFRDCVTTVRTFVAYQLVKSTKAVGVSN